MADFAREPFFSFVLSLAFPPFFVGVLAPDPVRGTAWWGYSLSATSIALILLAPLAGALADATGTRRPWLVGTLVLALAALTSLWFATAEQGHVLWTLMSVALAQLAIELSRIYTDSLLPSVARPGEMGRLSGVGVGLGFAASILFLGLGSSASFIGVNDDTAARALSAGSGAWLALFMLPCLLFCRQPRAAHRSWLDAVRKGVADLSEIWPRLAAQRRLRRFLIARMIYWDGTMCLFSFVSIIAATQLGWGTSEISIFGLAGLVAGALSGMAAGPIEARLGALATLSGAVAALLILTLMLALTLAFAASGAAAAGFSQPTDQAFLVFAILSCGALGVIMASSRSLLVTLADPAALGEAFGLYVMIGRASSFLAPLLVATTTWLTGDQGVGVFGVSALLLSAGLLLLCRVRADPIGAEARL